jgi:GNAT superfamily N-acetyltransferase
LSIRAIRPGDIDVVLSMVQKLYVLDTHFNRERHRRTMEELLAHPEYGGTWLIEADGAPAGYVVITICYSLEFGGRFALLDELFVEEQWRSQGLGSEALAFMEAWCVGQSVRAMRLEVWHQNPRALALYQRAGFEVQERHFMTKLGRLESQTTKDAGMCHNFKTGKFPEVV